jgi:hypothetical protein
MGRVHIRAREYQFQTHGEIDALQGPDYVNSMRYEFSHFLEPGIEFERDEIIGQRARAVRYGIAKADGQEKGAATEEGEEEWHDSGDESHVEEAPRFARSLQEEVEKPLEERQSRDCSIG